MSNELTPLFALEAEQLLEAGFPEEAIALCKLGLEIYPNYPTAVSLLVRALKHNGASEEAEITLENAKKHFPRNKIIETIEKYDELAALKSDFNMIASANSGSEMYDRLKSVSLISQQDRFTSTFDASAFESDDSFDESYDEEEYENSFAIDFSAKINENTVQISLSQLEQKIFKAKVNSEVFSTIPGLDLIFDSYSWEELSSAIPDTFPEFNVFSNDELDELEHTLEISKVLKYSEQENELSLLEDFEMLDENNNTPEEYQLNDLLDSIELSINENNKGEFELSDDEENAEKHKLFEYDNDEVDSQFPNIDELENSEELNSDEFIHNDIFVPHSESTRNNISNELSLIEDIFASKYTDDLIEIEDVESYNATKQDFTKDAIDHFANILNKIEDNIARESTDINDFIEIVDDFDDNLNLDLAVEKINPKITNISVKSQDFIVKSDAKVQENQERDFGNDLDALEFLINQSEKNDELRIGNESQANEAIEVTNKQDLQNIEQKLLENLSSLETMLNEALDNDPNLQINEELINDDDSYFSELESIDISEEILDKEIELHGKETIQEYDDFHNVEQSINNQFDINAEAPNQEDFEKITDLVNDLCESEIEKSIEYKVSHFAEDIESIEIEDITDEDDFTEMLKQNLSANVNSENDKEVSIIDEINKALILNPRLSIEEMSDHLRYGEDPFEDEYLEDEIEVPEVTETIANIYFSQGFYDEAIEAFTKLIDIEPERRDFFQEKIAEVKSYKENYR